jgi:hypothetical protein
MSRLLNCVILMFLANQFCSAQNPADISFSLVLKNGKAAYRQGEAIPVELRFESNAPGKYQVITDPSARVHLNSSRAYDHFAGDPPAYAVDPLREQTRMVEAFAGAPPRLSPVSSSPLVIVSVINDWISFRKPGRYVISAETERVSLVDPSKDPAVTFMPKSIPLRSNTIEIEIVAPEEGWAEAELRQAVTSLEGFRSAVGRPLDPNRAQKAIDAAQVLRYLGTRDAALALVHFFERGPEAIQNYIVAGLYGSPYRDEVIAALREGLTAADVAVTSNWIDTLSELTTAQAFGPCPAILKEGPALKGWLDRFRSEINRNIETLAGAVDRKQGQARAVSLDVLSRRNGPAPAPPDAVAAVLRTFHDLPENTQQRYLTMDWPRIASPEVLPMIRSLAEGPGPLRDTALARLQELDPAAARPIILDRIRKGDNPGGPYGDPRLLLQLPDRVLPEMDQPLADLLEKGKEVEALVSRYASDAVFGRIHAWVEAHPYSVCEGGRGSLLPYLFRVDPAYAADRLTRTRKSQPGECILSGSPGGDPFLNPGIEKAAIADLSDPNPSMQRCALTLLAGGGSAAAEEPIWQAFARFHENGTADQGLEYGFMDALIRGMGWIMTPEKLGRLAALCITDSCRQNVEAMRRGSGNPVAISISGMPNITAIRINLFEVFGARQLEAKIRQFPPGTRFSVPASYRGVWYYEQRMSEIRRILEVAGMQIVD